MSELPRLSKSTQGVGRVCAQQEPDIDFEEQDPQEAIRNTIAHYLYLR